MVLRLAAASDAAHARRIPIQQPKAAVGARVVKSGVQLPRFEEFPFHLSDKLQGAQITRPRQLAQVDGKVIVTRREVGHGFDHGSRGLDSQVRQRRPFGGIGGILGQLVCGAGKLRLRLNVCWSRFCTVIRKREGNLGPPPPFALAGVTGADDQAGQGRRESPEHMPKGPITCCTAHTSLYSVV